MPRRPDPTKPSHNLKAIRKAACQGEARKPFTCPCPYCRAVTAARTPAESREIRPDPAAEGRETR